MIDQFKSEEQELLNILTAHKVASADLVRAHKKLAALAAARAAGSEKIANKTCHLCCKSKDVTVYGTQSQEDLRRRDRVQLSENVLCAGL